jgi:uncharacterized protein YmfQ (DUF2313 family)
MSVTDAKQLKSLEIYELEESSQSSVWVVNMTKPAGHVNLTVSDGMGKSIALRILKTWIPIDLTTQATKQSLLANPQFRGLVAKRMLRIVDAKEAREFMKNPDAQAEYEKIYGVGPIAAIGQDPSAGGNELSARMNEASGDINPFALNLAVAKDMDDDSVIRELRNRSDEMKQQDWQYLAQMHKSDKVKAFAAERAV